jgi:small subunit ribosomal protein S16
MLKIRLKRMGRRHQPSFRMVVMEASRPRDGKTTDELGFYNPLSGEVEIDTAKALEWLKKGAQPTKAAEDILSRFGVMKQFHQLKQKKKAKEKRSKSRERVKNA